MGQLDWPIDIATAVSTGSLPGTCRMPYYGKDVGSHVLQGTLLAEDAQSASHLLSIFICQDPCSANARMMSWYHQMCLHS